jgi:hypothetical protein
VHLASQISPTSFRWPRCRAGLAVALVALFVALGGSAVASIAINGSSIKRGSITGA